MYQEMTCLWN